MIGAIAGMAASTLLPMLISEIGEAEAAGDERKAAELRAQYRAEIEKLQGPQFGDASAQEVGPSAMGGVSTDPALRAAQMSALRRLQEVGDLGGMDPESRAAQAEAQQESMRQEQAQRAAIMSSARARGMGSSGQSLNAALIAQQGSADRSAQMGLQAAADARRRAMAALAQSGQLAGQVRGQEWGEQESKARAADEIAAWNASARERSGLRKDQQALAQARFETEKAGMLGGATQGDIAALEAAAERKRRKWDARGSAVGAAAGGFSGFAGGKGGK